MNDDVHQLRLVADTDTRPAADAGAPAERTRRTPSSGRSLAEFGEVLTVEEAAAVLRISRASAYEAARVWRATHTDGIPVVQIGRRLLVPRSALEELLAATTIDLAARQRPEVD